MYPKITLIILTIAANGCSPLRSTRSERHETLAITDSTFTTLFRQEFERQIGTLCRTVVEFYPPAEYPEPSDDRLPNPTDTLRAVLPPPKIPATSVSRQPVKHVVYTEVSMQNDRTILTDSISHSRINTAARNDVQEQIDEQPSSGAAWLKWATALVVLTLLLLLFLKLR
ncbi:MULTISPECIES: hypothetical protein [Alistipes]|uniref:hypothetical protein n=1 Tax=Alistipes TaxID=239759 RepID=UPI001B36FCB7|nr:MULTISPECIES: hypothetical protein [Alistipes]MBQ4902220.1 hypothetical protein [Alistipes sp. Marseille-P2263]MCI2257493.1 hypothetical protein [Alistipes dispar]